MKGMLFLLAVTILSMNVNADDCILTEEYIAVRSEATKMVYGDDNDLYRCREAAQAYAYWLAMSKCVEKGDGKDIGGRCAHLVSRGKYYVEPDISHCQIFYVKPTIELAKALTNELVIERNIQKCKSSHNK